MEPNVSSRLGTAIIRKAHKLSFIAPELKDRLQGRVAGRTTKDRGQVRKIGKKVKKMQMFQVKKMKVCSLSTSQKRTDRKEKGARNVGGG